MSRLIDLTAPLGHPDLCEVPTFPPVEYWQFHEHPTHGRQNSAVRMAIHQGTHLDAPNHFYPDGVTIDEMPLETFCGRAVKIDLRETAREASPITREMIESSPGFKPERLEGAIAVTWTGWSKEKFFTPDYFGPNPYLDKEACLFLCDCGMKALCMDHAIDPGHAARLRGASRRFPRAPGGAGPGRSAHRARHQPRYVRGDRIRNVRISHETL